MNITSSYGMKLTGDLKALENTITIYRDSLCFIIPIVDAHWDEVQEVSVTMMTVQGMGTELV